MAKRRAVLFCNGLRERMLRESGGLSALDGLFDCFVDTSPFSKPWEYQQSYGDRVSLENSVTLQSVEAAEFFFSKNQFDYVLFVGLEWSRQREALVASVSANVKNWGILFVRGDMRELFRGRKYDDRWQWRWRKWRRLHQRKSYRFQAGDYFSNEMNAVDFPEVGETTNRVLVNHTDRHFLDLATPEQNDAGIVFLDQAITYTYADSDANIFVERFFDEAKAQKYFEHLNEYLGYVSKVTGHRVTICLHPNWPEDRPTLFDKRFRVVRKNTVPSLMAARMAVTHSSMATGFCHMLRIPTALVTLPSDVLPSYVQREIDKKSRNEELPIHRWPSPKPLDVDVPPADNVRIRRFLTPDEGGGSLESVLRHHIASEDLKHKEEG